MKCSKCRQKEKTMAADSFARHHFLYFGLSLPIFSCADFVIMI